MARRRGIPQWRIAENSPYLVAVPFWRLASMVQVRDLRPEGWKTTPARPYGADGAWICGMLHNEGALGAGVISKP